MKADDIVAVMETEEEKCVDCREGQNATRNADFICSFHRGVRHGVDLIRSRTWPEPKWELSDDFVRRLIGHGPCNGTERYCRAHDQPSSDCDAYLQREKERLSNVLEFQPEPKWGKATLDALIERLRETGSYYPSAESLRDAMLAGAPAEPGDCPMWLDHKAASEEHAHNPDYRYCEGCGTRLEKP